MPMPILRDLLSSFPLSSLAKIDRLYLGQMGVMLKYCRKLNERAIDQASLRQADRAIRSVIDVLPWITPESSLNEETRKVKAGGEFDKCVQEVRSAIESLCGQGEAVSFIEDLSIKRVHDLKTSERVRRGKAFLGQEFSVLRNTRERTIKFCVWEPYVPPVASTDVQQYVSHRQLTFGEDTSLATALVYFQAELKRDPPDRWSMTDSISDSLLFYDKFPLTSKDLSIGRHAALPLILTIRELAENALSQDRDTGESKDRPLVVQVLADRKTYVFLESPGQRMEIRNVYRISDAFILKDKNGDLLSMDALRRILPDDENANPGSQLKPNVYRSNPLDGQTFPARGVETCIEILEEVVKTTYEDDLGHHWWYCMTSQTGSPSSQISPQFSPTQPNPLSRIGTMSAASISTFQPTPLSPDLVFDKPGAVYSQPVSTKLPSSASSISSTNTGDRIPSLSSRRVFPISPQFLPPSVGSNPPPPAPSNSSTSKSSSNLGAPRSLPPRDPPPSGHSTSLDEPSTPPLPPHIQLRPQQLTPMDHNTQLGASQPVTQPTTFKPIVATPVSGAPPPPIYHSTTSSQDIQSISRMPEPEPSHIAGYPSVPFTPSYNSGSIPNAPMPVALLVPHHVPPVIPFDAALISTTPYNITNSDNGRYTPPLNTNARLSSPNAGQVQPIATQATPGSTKDTLQKQRSILGSNGRPALEAKVSNPRPIQGKLQSTAGRRLRSLGDQTPSDTSSISQAHIYRSPKPAPPEKNSGRFSGFIKRLWGS